MCTITLGLVLLSGLILSNTRAYGPCLFETSDFTHQNTIRYAETGAHFESVSIAAHAEDDPREALSCSSGMPCSGAQQHGEAFLYSASSGGRVFFTLADAASSPHNGFAPGTVVLSIKTMGVKKWFSTNTAALLTRSGTACVIDAGPEAPSASQNSEVTTYAVIDGNHVRLSLRKPHVSGATLLIGGGCQFEPDGDL